MAKMQLRTLLYAFGAATLVVGLLVFGSILHSESKMDATVDRLLEHDIPVMDRAHRLKLSVVQVQQWLTDISATRGLDGLNDGFDEAKANAELFASLVGELEALDPGRTRDYKGMREAFANYYAVGKQMAQAYVDQGPAGGNVMMARFDAAAAAMGEKIEAFVEQARTAVTQAHAETTSLSAQLSWITFAGVALFIVLVGGMAWVFRSVLHQIGHDPGGLESIASRIADGDLHTDSGRDASKATGVYAALLRMRAHLAEQMDEISKQARDNGRMRTALDNATSAITVSDDDDRLIFINRSAQTLFKQLEPELKRYNATFTATGMPGSRIADHFDDADLAAAFAARDDVDVEHTTHAGDHTLTLHANRVYAEDGSYIGRITEWRDITEQLAREQADEARNAEEHRIAEENLRIRTALDHVSSSVMVADNARRIIYMNKTAGSLFGSIEDDIRKDLPGFDADTLIGTNIDSFHRNPQHQIGLLENLRNTHSSELHIGGRTMRIIANPVTDANGNRVGTAVEWADRTAEVAIQDEIGTLVAAVRDGDLDQRIDEAGKDGFYLELATGFNALIGDLHAIVGDVASSVRLLAGGDLSGRIAADYAGAFGALRNDVNTTLDELNSIVGELHGFAGSISQASEEISSGNDSLSARTEQQASNLEETASSMEELNSTVRNNADNANAANQVAHSAREAAERGGQVVAKAVDAMQRISASSDKIAEIIGVIDEIAFQTNLLALNASVEAARAGEQGRGFAVVATEVRNLASRSADAAKQIKELISDSVDKVRSGTELVNQSGEVLEDLVGGVKKVGDIVAEIAAASGEQASGIGQVNQAISSIDELTQRNAALAEETSAASVMMKGKAGEMRQRMAFFKLA